MKEWSHEAKQKRFGLGTKAFGFQGSGFGGEEVQVLGGFCSINRVLYVHSHASLCVHIATYTVHMQMPVHTCLHACLYMHTYSHRGLCM